jgi:hypothetical protein
MRKFLFFRLTRVESGAAASGKVVALELRKTVPSTRASKTPKLWAGGGRKKFI